MSDPTALTPADAQPFAPTRTQALAKTRLHARLAATSGITDVESLTLTQLVAWCGDRRVEAWLRDPQFALWLFDRDSTATHIQSLKDLAVATLEDILLADYEPKVLTAKDKLKAADMLLQLNGAYPRQAPRRFDAELEAMDDAEVTRQLDEARRKLALDSGGEL